VILASITHDHVRLAVFLVDCVSQSVVAEFKRVHSSHATDEHLHVLQPLLSASFTPLNPSVTDASISLVFSLFSSLF